jgi:hypothetical protein
MSSPPPLANIITFIMPIRSRNQSDD